MPATAATALNIDKGLANTIVAESQMSFIDGASGILEYVGIDIDSLARHSTYEETVFLLWNRRLPTKAELDAFSRRLREQSDLPQPMWAMISSLPKTATPMHALRTLVSAVALHDPQADDASPDANERKAVSLVARLPALVAGFDRHRKGRPFVKPDPSLPVAANFLNMLNGERPTDTMARALDVCLILHADHGFNASTFAARVIISTLSDMYSAITGAIGALKGPLHGGANEEVMHMLKEIESIENVEPYIRRKLQAREKVMGFGHRVYKTFDPRATFLKTFARQLAKDTGNEKLYEMSRRIEEIMEAEVGSKGIHPNVDFYSATTYFSLGLELDLFTPMFAIARVSGWCGHCIEQLADNKLIRPRCDYTGPHKAEYVPIAQR
jgi:citrate synthase